METFVAHAAEADPLGNGVAWWVEKDFRGYLRCGVLAHGFARARFEDCGRERLIPFSCKGRGICPSCDTRRMAELAAHLTDHVPSHLPIRQWVLSVPKRLRPFPHHNPDLAGAVLRIFLRAILTLPEPSGVSGAYFVDLRLTDDADRAVSTNFYWLSTRPDMLADTSTWYMRPVRRYADLTALRRMPAAAIDASVRFTRSGDSGTTHVTLRNTGKTPAFFVRVEVTQGAGGEEVLPVFWQDNYVSLLPGETRRVVATYRQRDLGPTKPVVEDVGVERVVPDGTVAAELRDRLRMSVAPIESPQGAIFAANPSTNARNSGPELSRATRQYVRLSGEARVPRIHASSLGDGPLRSNSAS